MDTYHLCTDLFDSTVLSVLLPAVVYQYATSTGGHLAEVWVGKGVSISPL